MSDEILKPIKPDDELEYFYVTYTVLGVGSGATVLKQHRSRDGMNIAGAIRWLMKMTEHFVRLDNWKEISKKRYDEYLIVNDEIINQAKGLDNAEKARSHLSLLTQKDEQMPN